MQDNIRLIQLFFTQAHLEHVERLLKKETDPTQTYLLTVERDKTKLKIYALKSK